MLNFFQDRTFGQDYLRKTFTYSDDIDDSRCEVCGLDLKLHIYATLDFDGFVVACSMKPPQLPGRSLDVESATRLP